jgi:hypothetical protein
MESIHPSGLPHRAAQGDTLVVHRRVDRFAALMRASRNPSARGKWTPLALAFLAKIV